MFFSADWQGYICLKTGSCGKQVIDLLFKELSTGMIGLILNSNVRIITKVDGDRISRGIEIIGKNQFPGLEY